MKTIIKSILIALTIVCAINCSKEIIPLETTTSDNEDSSKAPRSTLDLNYELKQKHFETWHQIENYIGSNKEVHRIVDVNQVWLEFENGYCSNPVNFEIIYKPKYTDNIICENPKSYLNTVINYDNGFKIGETIIECSFIIENTKNLIFSFDDRNIEISLEELQYCPITPISLHINNVDNSYIYTTLQIEIYHPDNVMVIGSPTSAVESTEVIEIPLTIKH